MSLHAPWRGRTQMELDAFHERSGTYPECVGESNDRRQPRVPHSAFEKRDLRAVKAGGVPEGFLGHSGREAGGAQVRGELVSALHPEDARRSQT